MIQPGCGTALHCAGQLCHRHTSLFLCEHIQLCPDNFISAPNTVHNSSRHGAVAARLTSERPDSVIPLQKHLLCWECIHSFGHCGRFWNGWKMFGGVFFLSFLFIPAQQEARKSIPVWDTTLQFTVSHLQELRQQVTGSHVCADGLN